MHTYNRRWSENGKDKWNIIVPHTYGAQRVAFASQEEEEGKKMHEDLGMSDAPWRDQQQHPLGKNLCHFYNELQPKDTSCVWMCVNLCKQMSHSAHFKMNGLFTLKDLLEKKGHKAYASSSGSTHILIWVKIAMREE